MSDRTRSRAAALLVVGLLVSIGAVAPAASAADPLTFESVSPVFISPKNESLTWASPKRTYTVRWNSPALDAAGGAAFGALPDAIVRQELVVYAAALDEEGCDDSSWVQASSLVPRVSLRRTAVRLAEALRCYRFELRFHNAAGAVITAADSGVVVTSAPRTGRTATTPAPAVEWSDPDPAAPALRAPGELTAALEVTPLAPYFEGDTRARLTSARLGTYVGPAPAAGVCPAGPAGYRLRGATSSVLAALADGAAELPIRAARDGRCRFLRLTVRDGAYRTAISDSAPFYFEGAPGDSIAGSPAAPNGSGAPSSSPPRSAAPAPATGCERGSLGQPPAGAKKWVLLTNDEFVDVGCVTGAYSPDDQPYVVAFQAYHGIMDPAWAQPYAATNWRLRDKSSMIAALCHSVMAFDMGVLTSNGAYPMLPIEIVRYAGGLSAGDPCYLYTHGSSAWTRMTNTLNLGTRCDYTMPPIHDLGTFLWESDNQTREPDGWPSQSGGGWLIISSPYPVAGVDGMTCEKANTPRGFTNPGTGTIASLEEAQARYAPSPTPSASTGKVSWSSVAYAGLVGGSPTTLRIGEWVTLGLTATEMRPAGWRMRIWKSVRTGFVDPGACPAVSVSSGDYAGTVAESETTGWAFQPTTNPHYRYVASDYETAVGFSTKWDTRNGNCYFFQGWAVDANGNTIGESVKSGSLVVR